MTPPPPSWYVPHIDPTYPIEKYIEKGGEGEYLDCDRFGAMSTKGIYQKLTHGGFKVNTALGGWHKL